MCNSRQKVLMNEVLALQIEFDSYCKESTGHLFVAMN